MWVPSVPAHDSSYVWSRGCLGPWGGGRGGSGDQTEAEEENHLFRAPSSGAQERPPYNLKAFNLLISFPEQYPFMPPTVTFTTKIYHPNVDSSGQVCLPIISRENWKPYTKTCQGGFGPCLKGGAEAGWGLWLDFELEKLKREEMKNCRSQPSLSSDRRDAS